MEIFKATTGGGETMCQKLDLNFLGKVPLEPKLGESCENGKSHLEENPDSAAAKAFSDIVKCKFLLIICIIRF